MKDFYQDYLTDKSFQILTDFRKKYQFILIGGWAVYFYTKSLKSKDIDIIINFNELEKLKKDFFLEKNERLRKYQIKIEEIDIDVYLPFYSNLGIPVEDLMKDITVVNNFLLLKIEPLLITKINGYFNRQISIKGQKDLIDIWALLLFNDFDFEYFLKLIKKYQLKKLYFLFLKLIKETKQIKELKVNQHSLGKKKEEIVKSLERFDY